MTLRRLRTMATLRPRPLPLNGLSDRKHGWLTLAMSARDSQRVLTRCTMSDLIIRYLDFGMGVMVTLIAVMLLAFPVGSIIHDYGLTFAVAIGLLWALLITYARCSE